MIAHILKQARDSALYVATEYSKTVYSGTTDELEKEDELFKKYHDLNEAYEDFMDNQWGSLNKNKEE